jgi:hypothetical protein
LKSYTTAYKFSFCTYEDVFLHGHGDYVLSNATKHYFVPDQVWTVETKEEKEKILTNFMKDNRKKRTAGMMTSTDGTYSVIN